MKEGKRSLAEVAALGNLASPAFVQTWNELTHSVPLTTAGKQTPDIKQMPWPKEGCRNI